jgi:Fe-S oxidoreductase
MTAALWERLLFAGLLLASAAGFAARFGKVLRIILSSKRDPIDVLANPIKRVRDFVWEVLLQAKVIRERPLPGIAHALVFWGFCAFALVTLDHLAAGFGWRLLDREGTFGRIYFFSAALFAAAVTVAIAGLGARRFIARPRWLGPKLSYESGFIALLIATLMLTYLADYLFHTGPAVWWLHSLALLVFLPLIPHTKHLHLVLSPVTIFLKRPGFSDIPPLSGDEDFGLDTGKDLTRLDALQAYSCVECGRCTEHCPANNTGKILNPKEIILGVRNYLNEFGPAGEQPLLGTHVSQEAAFQCTTCGACEYQCPVGIQHLPVIIGLRRGAVNTGKWEDDHGARLFLNLERNGNALGMNSSERDKFIQKNELPIFDGSQEYCFWLGCMGSYDPKGREIVTALARVLRHLNISFGVLKKERCTGDPARRLGNDLAFDELAARNLETLQQANVKKMVSICPHCVRTIGEDWRAHGQAPPIEHHSELLARYSERLPRPSEQESVVFHDPCYLGRYRGVYEEPRAVAALGGPLEEAPRSHQRSFCCGAGGGLAFLGEEKGKRVSAERAEELTATGAKVIAAACPFCNTMFRDALASISPAPPKLLDIAQIAAAGIDRGAAPAPQ